MLVLESSTTTTNSSPTTVTNMLTNGSNQYIQPDYLSPLPTTVTIDRNSNRLTISQLNFNSISLIFSILVGRQKKPAGSFSADVQSDRRRPNTDFFFFFFHVVRLCDQNGGGEAVEEEPGDVVCQRDVQIEQQNAAVVVVQTVGGVRSVRPSGRVDERRSRVVGRAEQIRIQEPWIFFRRRRRV